MFSSSPPPPFSPSQKPVSFSYSVPSPKITFPTPISISYESWPTSQFIINYRPEDVSKIADAIRKLTKFCNITQKENSILIKVAVYHPNKAPSQGVFFHERDKQTLHIKFPDETTKNTFINIFNIDSQFIIPYSNNNLAIKVDPQFFVQYSKHSACLIV